MSELKDFWREIDKYPMCAPPGAETGGQRSFIIWFGFLALMLILLGT